MSMARCTSPRSLAPAAISTGFPVRATFSSISGQVMSPEPILNSRTYGSSMSTASTSYGVLK
jgi:hypothetical protein